MREKGVEKHHTDEPFKLLTPKTTRLSAFWLIPGIAHPVVEHPSSPLLLSSLRRPFPRTLAIIQGLISATLTLLNGTCVLIFSENTSISMDQIESRWDPIDCTKKVKKKPSYRIRYIVWFEKIIFKIKFSFSFSHICMYADYIWKLMWFLRNIVRNFWFIEHKFRSKVFHRIYIYPQIMNRRI